MPGTDEERRSGRLASPSMHKLLRYLRISFLTTCVFACLLLIVMWVRTSFSCDTVWAGVPGRYFFIATSRQGGLGMGVRLQPVAAALWDVRFNPPETQSSFPYKTAVGFGVCWVPNKGLYFVRAPYWALIAGVEMAAFVGLRGGRWRFSLRAMLIGMTVVAVVLGALTAWLG